MDGRGVARMVDVTGKEVTSRSATATGSVLMSATARRLLAAGELAKGDALAVARIAGIAAAKRTPDLIPLCHPIAIGAVSVEVTPSDDGVAIEATVASADRTGVEMEALTCVSVAALTVVDMVKAVDRSAVIGPVRVTAKTGGRSGDWRLGQDGRLARSDVRRAEPDSEPVDETGCPVAHAAAAGALAQTMAGEPVGAGPAGPRGASAGLAGPRGASSRSQLAEPGRRAPLAGKRVAVITVSDRRAAGEAVDTAGPAAAAQLAGLGAHVNVVVVPDGIEEVRSAVRTALAEAADVVVTTGGTGIGPRDLTPEALEPLVRCRLPGVEQAVRAGGATPFAALSRTIVGVVGDRTVVACLPGSARAVRESLDALAPLWGHLLGQLAGEDHAPAGPCDSAQRGEHR